MKKEGRYKASGAESEHEAGSDNLVLKNLKNIIDPDEIERFETILFADAASNIAGALDSEHKITVQDICDYHYKWLHEIYVWAGQYR